MNCHQVDRVAFYRSPGTASKIRSFCYSSVLVLLPIHVAFLHLIIDPACSLAKHLPWRIVLEAEPAEANVMNRPPRNPKEPLFWQFVWVVD
jgi:hypothetical protein